MLGVNSVREDIANPQETGDPREWEVLVEWKVGTSSWRQGGEEWDEDHSEGRQGG